MFPPKPSDIFSPEGRCVQIFLKQPVCSSHASSIANILFCAQQQSGWTLCAPRHILKILFRVKTPSVYVVGTHGPVKRMLIA